MLSVPENVRSSHSNLPADKQRIFAFPVRFEKEENTIMHGLSEGIMVFILLLQNGFRILCGNTGTVIIKMDSSQDRIETNR